MADFSADLLTTKDMFTLDNLLTSSGKYKSRADSPECTQEVKDNGTALLEKVNALLEDLGIDSSELTISSGFRTAEVNASTPGSAKKSLHMAGSAIDIAGHVVYEALEGRGDLLKKHKLWREDKSGAPTWTHLDDSTARADRPSRTFIA